MKFIPLNSATALRLNLIIVGFVLFSCTNHKENDIHYYFPSRMDKISTEQKKQLTGITYKITKFNNNGTEEYPSDSVVTFHDDGSIHDTSGKIGRWKEDRTLYLKHFEKKFFFNWISKGCNKIQLFTRYTEGNNKQIKRIQIYYRNIREIDENHSGNLDTLAL